MADSPVNSEDSVNMEAESDHESESSRRSIIRSAMENPPFNREASVFLAKLAMKAKCYDVMVKEMNKVADNVDKMTSEERTLVAEAYKKAIGPRMDFWRIVVSEQGEESTANVTLGNWYTQEMEGEIHELCRHFLSISRRHLIPSCSTPHTSVFYQTMVGDYYRYLADFIVDAGGESLKAYKKALDEAETELDPDDPIRLGVSVKLSIFYSRVKQDYPSASQTAQDAIDKATLMIVHVPYREADVCKAITRKMNVLQHNLKIWQAKLPK